MKKLLNPLVPSLFFSHFCCCIFMCGPCCCVAMSKPSASQSVMVDQPDQFYLKQKMGGVSFFKKTQAPKQVKRALKPLRRSVFLHSLPGHIGQIELAPWRSKGRRRKFQGWFLLQNEEHEVIG